MDVAPITLKNGGQVAEVAVAPIMLNLRRLADSGMDGVLALVDLAGLARDPGYDASYSLAVLVQHGLLERGGRLHESVRDVVLSAVTGEDFDMVLGSPYQAED